VTDEHEGGENYDTRQSLVLRSRSGICFCRTESWGRPLNLQI